MECMVELVNGNKGVAVITNGEEDVKENCARVFHCIISCACDGGQGRVLSATPSDLSSFSLIHPNLQTISTRITCLL